MFNNLELRLFEGLSLNMWGNISKINDQLSLPREGASEEEILLLTAGSSQLNMIIMFPSDYDIRSARYTSNIVNPPVRRIRSGGDIRGAEERNRENEG